MFQEPSSYWEPFRNYRKRSGENWIIQTADYSFQIGVWLTGAACVIGLWRIAFSM
jgi:hypothetical protein